MRTRQKEKAIQAEQSSASPEATVNSVGLNKDEKALAKKDEDRRRKAELKQIESNAERFVRNWNKATEVGNQIHTLRRTFTELFDESRPLLENVAYGFRHLRKGESIMGCKTLEEWSPKHCGVTARWLRKLLNPTDAKVFITDGTSDVIETKVISIADEEQQSPAAETDIDDSNVDQTAESSAPPQPNGLTKTELKKKVKEQEEIIANVRAVNKGQERQLAAQESAIAKVPVIPSGIGDVIPPAQFDPGDALKALKTFLDSTVKHMTETEVAVVYRSLAMELDDRLGMVTESEGTVIWRNFAYVRLVPSQVATAAETSARTSAIA